MTSTGSSKASTMVLADIDRLLDPEDEEAIAEVGAFVARATAGFVPLGEVKGLAALIGNAVEEGERLLEEEESEAGPGFPEDSFAATTTKGEPMPSRGSAEAGLGQSPAKTFSTAEQILEEVNRLASELIAEDPTLSPAKARMQVWKEHPELAELYRTLPSEAQGSKGPAPHLANPPQQVVKSKRVIGKVVEKARELRKADPSLSLAQAKTKVWETHPDLVVEYRRARRS